MGLSTSLRACAGRRRRRGHRSCRQLLFRPAARPLARGERGDEHLTLRIGAGVQAGQNFDLVPTAPNAFIAEPHRPAMLDLLSLPPIAIRFERDGGGRVTTLHASVDRIRGLRFTRR